MPLVLKNRVLRFFLATKILFCSLSVTAQIDSVFWFAAPEVTDQHGDRPVFFQFTSFSDTTYVTIDQPANPSWVPIIDTLLPNSTAKVDVTTHIAQIENDRVDTVMNRGLLITATSKIGAYYEVLGTSFWGVVNSDLFVLKGRNSLGTRFFTPFQTHWWNQPNINAWSSFDIVATEDSTEVTITLTDNALTHMPAIPFTIYLNRGETYSVRALFGSPTRRMSGSLVVSDKPIAITVKDDSIFENGAYDLAGDQIVPVELTGSQFALVKSSGSYSSDRAFVVATENNTSIYINGSPLPIAIINQGQTYERQLAGSFEQLTTSAPVYVWQVTGFGRELGGALIPSIGKCTGSSQVGFTRDTDEQFNLNIIVESGYEDYFSINGVTTLVSASDFTQVPGTNGEWVAASITYSPVEIPSGEPMLIKNDSAEFHLGVLNGEATSVGFRYGYFSNFASSLDLGNTRYMCVGDSTTLNAGGGKDSYVWSTGDTASSITVTDTGKYWIETIKGVCQLDDTVDVAFFPIIPDVILLGDTSFCQGQQFILGTDTGFVQYNWNNGSTAPTVTPDTSGKYKVDVANSNGCTASDSINVTIYPIPSSQITHDNDPDVFCTDLMVTLDAGGGFSSYLWNTGDTSQIITTDQNWIYYVSFIDTNGCQSSDTVDVDCSTYIEVPNVFTPNGDGINEVFFVTGLHPFKWRLEVYNRYGERVFLGDPYQNNWDGSDLSEGIYYFALTHLEGKGFMKGWVQVLR